MAPTGNSSDDMRIGPDNREDLTPMKQTSSPALAHRPPRRLLVTLWGACLCAASSCRSVEYYEKEALSDPVMDLAGQPGETHFYQKVFFSIEGAAGGIGRGAGGGCGCY
jgi:hypothetical protein